MYACTEIITPLYFGLICDYLPKLQKLIFFEILDFLKVSTQGFYWGALLLQGIWKGGQGLVSVST